jgi:ligand-binding sensor domain-containing protein
MIKFVFNRNLLVRFILFIFILNQYLLSQTLNFQHLSLQDGLSQNCIYSILQDSKGLIWLGTQDGLNKFDGYNFTVINQDLVEKNKLTDSHILCLYEDNNHMIWIGTWSGGLNLYDPVLQNFHHFKFDEGVKQTVQNNKITAIIGDNLSKDNVLWIGTDGGGFSKLWFKNENHFYFEHFKHNPKDKNSLASNNVTSLFQDKNGLLWIGTEGGGLNKFDPTTNEFQSFTNFNNNICVNNISCIYEYVDGSLWLGTNGSGLVKFNPQNEKCEIFKKENNNPNSLSDNKILCISSFEENSGKYLLIGTEGAGLNEFNLVNNEFIHYKPNSDDENSISHNKVNFIFTENSENIWFGTDNGIDIYDRNVFNFRKYKHIPGNKNSLSNEYVWCIYESRDGMLWIATDNGLNRIDRKNRKYKHWFNDPKNANSIGHNEMMSIYEDKNGFMWIGTWYGGLNKFDRKRNTFKRFLHNPNNPNSISDNKIRIIYEDPISNGNILWLGTKDGGLIKFDIRTESAINYLHNPEDNTSISDNSILSIMRDSEKTLWIGTWGRGLNKFDEQKQQFITYKHDAKNPYSITHNSISMTYEDRAGNFWVGTHGGGLSKFDRKNERFTSYTTRDGLPNNVIYGILEDEEGFIWLSTNKGISRFDPKVTGKDAFKNFDVTDGLQSNEFNNGAFFKSKSGELFFGGVNGFNSFFPKSIVNNKYLPPVVFTDFKIFNQSVNIHPDSILKKSITYANNIELDYDQSVFSIEFSALNYTHPEKNQYKYKLIGFDKEWTFTNAERRFVTYTNLEPGEYAFLVKASNNDGYWNEINASLKITILPPFWLTWWFRFTVITIIAGLILAGHTRRMNKVENLNIKLEAEVSRRTNELESQKNELQIALSHVNQLSGLLPICASCKKIRDDKGYWNQIESYIAKHSEADFSHGICPDCYKDLYPELVSNRLKRNKNL